MFTFQKEQRQINRLLKKYPEHKEWYKNRLEEVTLLEEWQYFKNNPAKSVELKLK